MTLDYVYAAHIWAHRSGAVVVWYRSQRRHVLCFGIIFCPLHHAACHSVVEGDCVSVRGICLN